MTEFKDKSVLITGGRHSRPRSGGVCKNALIVTFDIVILVYQRSLLSH
jgi:hypothetical protein